MKKKPPKPTLRTVARKMIKIIERDIDDLSIEKIREVIRQKPKYRKKSSER